MQATKTRTRKQVERKVTIGAPTAGVFAVHMVIGTGETARHFGYYLRLIPADFGVGFEVEKFGVEQTEGADAVYHVHIDTDRGYHSCTCKGGSYCGHCKHMEAILALLKCGKLTLPARKPVPAPEPLVCTFDDP